ncbi:VOC family protein [Alkaliphilus transvaalensis]|uniref:VOC family protein n=1 Tax=Alkaliphilus transvaalensis TaxID=114628 RepID=UPI00047D6D6C|nr:VOC family protein [Alkaliphilus transvaalensis]
MSKYHRQPNLFVGQIEIKVSKIERSLRFYQDILGFSILEKGEDKVLLTADGKKPLITIHQPKGVLPKEERTTGLYHIAILLPQPSDLGAILKKLIAEGYPLQGASHHGISEAIYLQDPDGNGIEIYTDTPDSTWVWENGLIVAEGKALDMEALLSKAEEEEWLGMPQETLLGHIHLSVAELKAAEEFYRKGLGFDIVMSYPDQAIFFSTGGYHHHVAVNVWKGLGAPAPKDNSVGLGFFTLMFPNEGTREKTVNHLKELGYLIQMENGIVTVEDPSKNKIKLMVCEANRQ